MLGLQARDDAARQLDPGARLTLQQFQEGGLVQAHQYRVAHRHHAGRPRRIGVEAELADDLTAPHLAHHARSAVLARHVGTQAAAHRQVERVSGLALRHQGLTGRHLHPAQLLAQQRQAGRVERAEGLHQQVLQQLFVETILHRPTPLESARTRLRPFGSAW